MGWQETNEAFRGHYHLKQRTSCCHQNLFSGIYNFHRFPSMAFPFIYAERHEGGREEMCQSGRVKVGLEGLRKIQKKQLKSNKAFRP